MRQVFRIAFGLGAILAIAGVPHISRAQSQRLDDAKIHVLPVRANIYMLVGPNGNMTVSVGPDGVLAVDTMSGPLAREIQAAIRTLTGQPLRAIINTSYWNEHTGGNEELSKWGGIVVGGNFTAQVGVGAPAAIFAHENVLNRMSAPTGKEPPTPPGAWPTNTFSGLRKDVFFNGEGIRITHVPAANTDGDSIVFFRRSDVISTGDVFVTNSYPRLDLAAGGGIDGEIAAVNYILGEVIPVYGQEGGTLIVPGHGRLCDLGDLVDFREMLTIVRDRVQDMIEKGMSLDQVKDAKPTLDYNGEYGSATADTFVEAVYKSLKGQ
jgi:glyoxylase-like metal-dependent hydrolase (beta-lactamase superfamily II)